MWLTLCMLGKSCSRRYFDFFFWFFLENGFDISCKLSTLHEVWDPVVWRKYHHENIPYLYNSDPLKPHFYIVKLGFTGVYIIFLISAQKHRLWVLVKTASCTHNLCFGQKYENISEFLSENFLFLVVKFSIYLNRRVFVISSVCRLLNLPLWMSQLKDYNKI